MKAEIDYKISEKDRSAFPFHWPDSSAIEGMFGFGLTKRELFAAMAMQGLCSLPKHPTEFRLYSDTAIEAVAMADALLAALEYRSTNAPMEEAK